MARLEVQMNTVGPQANTVAPADIYSRPYYDRNAGEGYMQLARSLGILGDTLQNRMQREQAGKDEYQYANYEALAAEFGNPEQTNASIITNAKDGIFNLFSSGKSTATVRNRVEEVQGDTAATSDFYSEKGYGSRLFALANDPAALQSEIKNIRAEAYAKVKDRPAFGDSYIKQIDTFLNGFQAATYKQREEAYKFQETANIAKTAVSAGTPDPVPDVALHDHMDGASNSLFSYLSKGKPKSYIDDLNPKMATAMQRLIAAAPPEIRSRIKIDSGARTPERQAELIAAELSGSDLASFKSMVAQHGAVKGGAMWAAANPQAAKSRGIGRMIALPGRSLHQHGYAIDLARDPKAEAWLHKNAGRFGLYYPMSYEPWHIELIGGRAARKNYSGIQSTEGAMERPTQGPFLPDAPAMNAGYRGYDNSPNFFENYYKTVMSVENTTGNPAATNSASTAMGNAQFVEATWMEQYGNKFGDTGETREEILAKRADPALAKTLAIQYAKENAKVLEGYAIPVNTTTLLMAHQMGAKGAAAVLTAFREDPSMPIENALSDEALAVNPQWQGKTVSQVFAESAGKTGEFTNPISGAKERTTIAYNEGVKTSPLGPEAFTKTFADAIINEASAKNSPEILDSMPDEIVAILPEYGAKVQAVREKIASERRAKIVFDQAQQEKAQKETTEMVLSKMAVAISEKPNAPIPKDVEQAILSLPNGGFEVMQKLNEFRKAKLVWTPEQKREDAERQAAASNYIVGLANGENSYEEAMDAIKEIQDPEAYGKALNELTRYRKVPESVNTPLAKAYKQMFMEATYGYIEGTPMKNPAGAVKVRQATKLYDKTLAALLASEPDKVDERRLLEIIDEVEAKVASKVLPDVVEGAGDASINKANQGETPAAPAAPEVPVVPVIPGITPEQQSLIDKYKPSNRFIGVGPR